MDKIEESFAQLSNKLVSTLIVLVKEYHEPLFSLRTIKYRKGSGTQVG